jgi:hypothetical protein
MRPVRRIQRAPDKITGIQSGYLTTSQEQGRKISERIVPRSLLIPVWWIIITLIQFVTKSAPFFHREAEF